MLLDEITSYLSNEKNRLFENRQAVQEAYNQIVDSIILLRDSFFSSYFENDPQWVSNINSESGQFDFPQLLLKSASAEEQNNSMLIKAVIWNIRLLIKTAVENPFKIDRDLLEKAIHVNSTTKEFILYLFREHFEALSSIQKSYSLAIRKNIEELFKATIDPFWEALLAILDDEIRIKLKPFVKSHPNSRVFFQDEDERDFENLVYEVGREQGLTLTPEMISQVRQDYNLSNTALADQLFARYKTEPQDQPSSGKIYRLREISLRYLAQRSVLQKLLPIVLEIKQKYRSPNPIMRFFEMILEFFLGHPLKKENERIVFDYTPWGEKAVRRVTSVNQLITSIKILGDYCQKSRRSIEVLSTAKVYQHIFSHEMRKIIDVCFVELQEIYDKAVGLKEFIMRKENAKTVEIMNPKSLDDFGASLMSLNHAIIINKENLKNLEIKTPDQAS
jgi:hypothetical protein